MSRRATRALSAIPPRAPKAAARRPLNSPAAWFEGRTERRRNDLFAVLDRHDQVTRQVLEHIEESRPACATATWAAVWQLRVDIAAALDRCEASERAARRLGDDD